MLSSKKKQSQMQINLTLCDPEIKCTVPLIFIHFYVERDTFKANRTLKIEIHFIVRKYGSYCQKSEDVK